MFMNRLGKNLIAAAIAALPLSGAMAANVSATLGLKMWYHNWSSWEIRDEVQSYNPIGTPGVIRTRTVIKDVESSNTQGWIPSFSVRINDFMIGGSYFAKRSYDFVVAAKPMLVDTVTGASATSTLPQVARATEVKREEFDLIGGYYVLPTLAIIAGYKEVDQWWGGEKYKYSGPIIGASASAPLTGGFSLYGSAAIGPLKLEHPGGAKTDADYRLGEVGLAYAFDMAGKAGIKSLIATFGYRSQAIISKLNGSASDLKGRDTTEGMTVGIVAAF
jgi:hypothetical protein